MRYLEPPRRRYLEPLRRLGYLERLGRLEPPRRYLEPLSPRAVHPITPCRQSGRFKDRW